MPHPRPYREPRGKGKRRDSFWLGTVTKEQWESGRKQSRTTKPPDVEERHRVRPRDEREYRIMMRGLERKREREAKQ